MSDIAEETLLARDADVSTPLRRVAYEAGMLLGLDATRDEQAYHRQRVNRQQYWLQGYGTLAGMAVAIDPPSSDSSDPITTRMTVGPGLGIDGLGREVNIHEGYCIDLGGWLQAQSETRLRDGYDEGSNRLWLKVTVRYQPCDVAKQPVLARKLNLSTDAVQPSRTADSILLELSPELPPPAGEDRYKPWGAHRPLDETPLTLSDPEQAILDQAETDNEDVLHRQLQLAARLLHAFDGKGSIDTELAASELEEGARLLLARVSIDVSDLNGILDADVGDPVVNPNDIEVNNMVRPFLMTASQLAYLARTATE